MVYSVFRMLLLPTRGSKQQNTIVSNDVGGIWLSLCKSEIMMTSVPLNTTFFA